MNGFQIITLTIVGLFLALTVSALIRRRIGLPSAMFWTALWTAAAVAIIEPDITVAIARFLGIARGADLVFYFAILLTFVGFFLVYAKLRRLEQALTKIVRQTAIDEARSAIE